jgi:predicted SAM-dependent methyltransferase
VKVQFCSGGSQIPGWENRDRDCDITQTLPYADNSVDAVRIEHGAEHVTTHECLRFFGEVHRILIPGGTFRLCVPVLDRLARDHARDIILNHGHACAFSTQLAMDFLYAAGFDKENIREVDRDEHDHHHKMIGTERDDLETARIVAVK